MPFKSAFEVMKNKYGKPKDSSISDFEIRKRADTLMPTQIFIGDVNRPRSMSSPKAKLFSNAAFITKMNKDKPRVHGYKNFSNINPRCKWCWENMYIRTVCEREL